jgi:3-oxocholest-4-en-26-oyl-CoA dehydrogenase beta subunit
MDFLFNKEQNLLRQSIREFLTKECESEYVRQMEEDEKGYTQELWSGMANLGWMGVVFPEKYGGTAGDLLDLVVMMEEMGRVCLPGPFFSTVILGGLTILEAGNELQRSEFLPKIVDGNMILTLALHEPSTTKYDPPFITVRADVQMDKYIVDGIKLFVPDANVADYIICVARTDKEAESREGITLFLVDANTLGIKTTVLKTITRDKQCEVVFGKVTVAEGNILGELNRGWSYLEKILQNATVAKCAEMIGGSQKMLEMTISYAKKREQFGRLIGSFQAVQHHCANMLMDIDGGKYITYYAAWLLNKGLPCDREVAAAKAWVNDAYRRVVALGHEILGGVGYMTDNDMELYSRRAKAAEIAFGDTNFHRQVVAQNMGL